VLGKGAFVSTWPSFPKNPPLDSHMWQERKEEKHEITAILIVKGLGNVT
jgi:hypothetical protein